MVLITEYLLTQPYSIVFGLIFLYLSVPNPLVQIPWLVFLAFVPLFYLNQKTNRWRRWLLNIVYCDGFSLLMITPLDPFNMIFKTQDTIVLILLVLTIAFIYSLFFSLSAVLSDKFGWQFSPFIYGIGWVINQYILLRIFPLLTFPIEVSLINYPIMIQTARYFGPYVLSFIIVFTNAAFAFFLENKHKKHEISLLLLLTIMHVGNIFAGYRLIMTQDFNDKPIKIAVIQPNINVNDYKLKESSVIFNKIFEKKLLDMTRLSISQDPDLIVWPELSGDYILQDDNRLYDLNKEFINNRRDLLVGTSYKDYGDQKKTKNIAFILKKNGDIEGPYMKRVLFPFSESGAFSSGRNNQPLLSSVGPIGVMICLESIYPFISKEHKKNGAMILIDISTDASFGNSLIPYIHAYQIVLRAVENNVYAVHVGNTGPSIASDNKGRIILKTKYGRSSYSLVNCFSL